MKILSESLSNDLVLANRLALTVIYNDIDEYDVSQVSTGAFYYVYLSLANTLNTLFIH